jgi:hypothetical protein
LGTVEPHEFNMGVMTENDFSHPLDLILDISPANSPQSNSGEQENSG